MNKSFYKILLVLLTGIQSITSFAKNREFKNITPTVSLQLNYSLSTTYKSKLVASNDVGTGFSYTLGGYAGKEGNFGFFVKVDNSATTFELNSSSNSVTWQDSIFRYRWGYLYLGPVFTTLTYAVNIAGTDTLDVSASGMGGNVGFLVPVGGGGSLYMDFTSVTPSKTVNELTQVTSMGARTDIDLGASIDLTAKLVDLVFGYRQQQYSVTTDASYAELMLSTYIGLKFSLFF